MTVYEFQEDGYESTFFPSASSISFISKAKKASAGQSWGPIAPQKWFGVRISVDSANTFVIQPLQRASFSNTDLGTALTQWQAASADQQSKWLDAYTKALPNATVTDGKLTVATGDYGPLPLMMSNLLGIAQASGLDGLLLINGRFYQTDYTQGTALHGRRQRPPGPGSEGESDRQPLGNDE